MCEKRLSGKTAVITGAARGIGAEIAIAFARNGANLVLMDLMGDNLSQLSAQIKRFGVDVLTETIDVTDQPKVQEAAERALARFGKIDILVNNAGIYDKSSQNLINPEGDHSFLNTNISFIRKVLDVNILGTFFPTLAFLPGMVAAKSGKVINLGSVAGVNGKQGMAEYSATKGAIISFTKALAHEVAPWGINVNCISPGSILVDGRTAPKTYLQRHGMPSDIAGAAVFLASSESDFIVGQNLIVDGGRTLSLYCEK